MKDSETPFGQEILDYKTNEICIRASVIDLKQRLTQPESLYELKQISQPEYFTGSFHEFLIKQKTLTSGLHNF